MRWAWVCGVLMLVVVTIAAAVGEGWGKVYRALESGDRVGVERLLAGGGDIDERDRLGRTPLHHAAVWGEMHTARFLLEHGADANARDEQGNTPLHLSGTPFAVATGFARFERALASGSTSASQSHWIGPEQHVETIRLLLDHGVDVNTLNKLGQTPLRLQAERSTSATVAFLIERGAEVTARDRNGWTPLHAAVASNQLQNVILLLAHGADVNASSRTVDSPLRLAAGKGQVAIAKILLDHGAQVNAANRGWTALHAAASLKDPAMTDLLLSRGARVDVRCDDLGATPLHRAASSGSLAAARLLLEHGADVNAPNAAGQTPLAGAVEYKEQEMVKLLREFGAL